MDILILQPHGYCPGVKRALELAQKALKEEEGPLLMIGGLVHNERVLAELKKDGIIFPTSEPLDTILGADKNDRLLFSAHGHPLAYEELAALRGLRYYDGTCPFVQENLEAALSFEGAILYLGIAGHDEAVAFQCNVPDCSFYDVKTGEWNPIKLKGQELPVGIICQTTLGNDEIETALKAIREYLPDVTVLKENCPSSKARQKVIENLKDVDALIIMGSPTSANSKQLVRIGESKGIESHLCLDVEAVKALDLSGKKKIALGSGASVPEATLQEALSYLRSL